MQFGETAEVLMVLWWLYSKGLHWTFNTFIYFMIHWLRQKETEENDGLCDCYWSGSSYAIPLDKKGYALSAHKPLLFCAPSQSSYFLCPPLLLLL